MTTTTSATAARTILAIDLGKYKSVACLCVLAHQSPSPPNLLLGYAGAWPRLTSPAAEAMIGGVVPLRLFWPALAARR